MKNDLLSLSIKTILIIYNVIQRLFRKTKLRKGFDWFQWTSSDDSASGRLWRAQSFYCQFPSSTSNRQAGRQAGSFYNPKSFFRSLSHPLSFIVTWDCLSASFSELCQATINRGWIQRWTLYIPVISNPQTQSKIVCNSKYIWHSPSDKQTNFHASLRTFISFPLLYLIDNSAPH